MWGSCGVGELWCGRVKVLGSCSVYELWCLGIALCGSCNVWELLCGSYGWGVTVLGSCYVEDLRHERVAVCVRELRCG